MGTKVPRIAPIAAALLMLGLLVGTARPAGALPAEPAVTVTPSTDLLDGQVVTVSGVGFSPNVTAYVSMCPPGAAQPLDCDSRFGTTAIDGTGGFTTDYAVVRFARSYFAAPSSTVDCALEVCTLGVTDDISGSFNTVQIPVHFLDPDPVPPLPTVTVSPTTDLVDGQRVTIEATGLRAYEPVSLRQCAPGAVDIEDCSKPLTTVRADQSGNFSYGSHGTALSRVMFEFGAYPDCAVVVCTVGISSIAGFQQVAVDFVDPTLTVDIEDVATLKVGTNDAVAKATISCDIATPLSFYASITQPGVDYGWGLFEQSCTPEEPLIAFIPARNLADDTNDYALGAATVTVSARPTRYVTLDPNYPETAKFDASETVQLLDFDAIKAAIDVGLADPANTELRAEVLQAIALRAAQDPVFRAELAAAISGMA